MEEEQEQEEELRFKEKKMCPGLFYVSGKAFQWGLCRFLLSLVFIFVYLHLIKLK